MVDTLRSIDGVDVLHHVQSCTHDTRKWVVHKLYGTTICPRRIKYSTKVAYNISYFRLNRPNSADVRKWGCTPCTTCTNNVHELQTKVSQGSVLGALISRLASRFRGVGGGGV